jgi:hypothetical protein
MAVPKILPDWKLSEDEYYEITFGDEQSSFWGYREEFSQVLYLT